MRLRTTGGFAALQPGGDVTGDAGQPGEGVRGASLAHVELTAPELGAGHVTVAALEHQDLFLTGVLVVRVQRARVDADEGGVRISHPRTAVDRNEPYAGGEKGLPRIGVVHAG